MRRRGRVLCHLDWRRGYWSSMVRDYKQSNPQSTDGVLAKI